ncbi:AAA family ATPase [Gordonia sp. NPDC003424]
MTSVTVCSSCGTELRVNARFCDSCGAATAQVQESAQYRQVTVLFADVVRSMNLAATVDIERLREIMTDVVGRCAIIVHEFGGTAEQTGDGVMAIFGAPTALEDHAFRGCLAAMAIQDAVSQLAAEIIERDGVTVELRVGLNSGRVIAGTVRTGSLGYVATGETMGLAQRMESAAPPGSVMLSESTASLVERATRLAEPEWLHIKGFDDPISGRRLLGIRDRRGTEATSDVPLVGRRHEMAAIAAMTERAIRGHGGAITIVGPPGIGKTRIAQEAATAATTRGIQVHWSFCESHTRDIPFHAVKRLLRAITGIDDLDGPTARAQLREQFAVEDSGMPREGRLDGATFDDVVLLEDLLDIAEPDATRPHVDPDARRRRVVALINSATLSRTAPSLFIVEDVHWIDPVSEAMLTDLFAVVTHSPVMVVITARPEYRGPLMRMPGSQAVSLAPLTDSDINQLLDTVLGTDPSVVDLARIIVERASGNPFFLEEIVRDLVGRGALVGERGGYASSMDTAQFTVPRTVQAAIAARIDRCDAAARKTLYAASVIGTRFETDLLSTLGIEPAVGPLLKAELIGHTESRSSAGYVFCHPLIQAVAYESQLKSDRAQYHRRLATVIQERGPDDSADDRAAVIAEHLQAAGDLRSAYEWHMRAGAWSSSRDLAAARLSWERARVIADALPDDDTARPALRLAPRTMLCATDYHGGGLDDSHRRFLELSDLCSALSDQVSLAIGMTGLITELFYGGQIREACRRASEQVALLESIGDDSLTMGLAFVALTAWYEGGDLDKILALSQIVIDLADGDPDKGARFGTGSPLAVALTWRACARWWTGVAGWRRDLDDAVAIARQTSSMPSQAVSTLAALVLWSYGWAALNGALRVDDATLQPFEESVRIAASGANDVGLSLAEFGLGIALTSRDSAADRRRGLEAMTKARDFWERGKVAGNHLPIVNLYVAQDAARRGDHGTALPVMRTIVDDLYREGRLGFGVWATGVLTEALLARGTDEDLIEARQTIDRLETLRADQGVAMRKVMLLRLRTLLARADGDDAAFRQLADRYHAMSEQLGYEMHTVWAAEMIDGTPDRTR